MEKQGHIAIDLGAESGRVVFGEVRAGRLWLQEVHRFPHRPLPTPSGLCWDITTLWREIIDGLRKAATHSRARKACNRSPLASTVGASIGPSSPTVALLWACRVAIVIRNLPPSPNKCATNGAWPATKNSTTPPASSSCLSTPSSNSSRSKPAILARLCGGQLLFIPDLFHWLLTGEANRRTHQRVNQPDALQPHRPMGA